MVKVVPVITEMHPPRAAVGDRVTIIGSGFAHSATDNVVTLARGRACKVIRTEVHFLVCVVGEVVATKDGADEGPTPTQQTDLHIANSASPTADAHHGIPLRLHESSVAALKLTAACFTGLQEPCFTALADQSNAATVEVCHMEAMQKLSVTSIDAAKSVEHFTVTSEARWPNLHPMNMFDGFRQDTFLATSTSTLKVPSNGTYMLGAVCNQLKFEELCQLRLSTGGSEMRDTLVLLDAHAPNASVVLNAGTAYKVELTFSHTEHGNQADFFVAMPSAADASVPAVHAMPIPAEWFSAVVDASGSTDPTELVQLVVNTIPALCRSRIGPSGCFWEYSDVTATDMKHVSERRLAHHRNRRTNRLAIVQPRVPEQQIEFAAEMHRWRRAIPSDAKRWSEYKAMYTPSSVDSPLIVPVGQTWVVDESLECEGLIVYGTLMWVRCTFFDRNLHSRMPLDPTHVRLKRTRV
jgi:hypothetical protein